MCAAILKDQGLCRHLSASMSFTRSHAKSTASVVKIIHCSSNSGHWWRWSYCPNALHDHRKKSIFVDVKAVYRQKVWKFNTTSLIVCQCNEICKKDEPLY